MRVQPGRLMVIGCVLSIVALLDLATACEPKPGPGMQAAAPGVTPADPSSPAVADAPTPPQAGPANGLAVVSQELTGPPELDPLHATTVEGETVSGESMRVGSPFEYRWLDDAPGMWAMLGESKLIASEHYSDDGQQGWVTVTRDGQEIYRIDTGRASPMSAVQGFFVYDGHWVLETNNYTDEDPFGGRITVDGVLLNDREGYEKAFNAQTIAGKLFYLYQHDGQIDAWYDGEAIALGYAEVPHYACCSGAEMNPYKGQDAVSFFGVLQGTWYLTEMRTPDALTP